MKPWVTLGTATAPDGTAITLARRDTEYVLLANGQLLMTSRLHASELQLAAIACATLGARSAPVVLVGGLGMGYTVRGALDALPTDATVVVAELMPSVVAWNEGELGALAGHPLRDPRVSVEARDVADVLRDSRGRFDAILLDVDNGADAFAATANRRLYGPAGLASLGAALRPGGVLAVWSAGQDRRFARHLRIAGFEVTTHAVRARPGGRGPRHVIFIARWPAA
jgi:spermidine synthase